MLIRLTMMLLAAVLAIPAPADAGKRKHRHGGASSSQQAQAPSSRGHRAVAAARRAVGTPYAYGGTSRSGFDCSGLTQWAYRKAGRRLPRTSFDQFRVGRPVARSQVRAGDLVFFDTAGPGPSHVGIATGPGKAISATSSGGVMQHSTRDRYWGSHYVGARRLR